MRRPGGPGRGDGDDGRGWSGRDRVFAALTVVGYLLAAVWARQLSLPGPVLIWFPPAGVAVGALYLRPRLIGLVMAAEALSTMFITDAGDDFGPLLLVVNTVGIVGSYALGAWVLRRLGLDPCLRTGDDMVRLAGGALVVAAGAATLVGVPAQLGADMISTDDLLRSAALFWIGDVVGIACLTPAILLLGSAFLDRQPLPVTDDVESRGHLWFLVEYMVPAVAAVVLMGIGGTPLRFVYLAFVPVIVIAVRHGITGAALSSAALGAVMTAGASVQFADALDRSDFQLLMLVLTITGVFTGAVVSARNDAQAAIRRISEIIEATPDLVATTTPDGEITYINPVGRQMLGVGARAPVDVGALDFFPDDLAVELTREGMRSAARTGSWTGENRLLRPDGHIVPVSQVIIAHRGESDGSITFSSVCRDVTDQRQLEDQLRRTALYDDATGLPNRALLLEALPRMTETPGRQAAVLFADIDHLPRVNETFGFAAGDRVVTAISHRIQRLIRGPDLVARYGGAQFVVAVPDVSDEFDAVRLAERLLDVFSEPVEVEHHRIRVTGSVGIALSPGDRDHTGVLRAAEVALHRAKEAGGGRVALFDEALDARWRARARTEADLREVLGNGAWRLDYQPVIDPVTRAIVSSEALLRWNHPDRGPVAPFELIRLAEESGAIVPLGRDIFRRACAQARAWADAGCALSVGINVSALQLRDTGFVQDVQQAIADAGIPAGRVIIELTETVLAGNDHGEIEALRELRRLGCRVAIDDFGTGYSSLAVLQHLPIDLVKVDQSFIRDLGTSPRAAALIESMLHMAEALDVVVVAEGVETEEQLEVLARLGCHRVQGFVFSPAVAPGELSRMFREGCAADEAPDPAAVAGGVADRDPGEGVEPLTT